MDIKQWLSEYPGLQLEYENLYLAQGKQESRMLHAQNTASQLDNTRKRKTEIEDAITSLDDPLDRAILRARYIHVDGPNLTTWRDVALRICGDDAPKDIQYVKRHHKTALDHLSQMIPHITKREAAYADTD